jgi:hypothetical protein
VITFSAVGVISALETIVMKIAFFAISGFQGSGFGFMNFDGELAKLASRGEALGKIGATGGASMNVVVDEISIANFV